MRFKLYTALLEANNDIGLYVMLQRGERTTAKIIFFQFCCKTDVLEFIEE